MEQYIKKLLGIDDLNRRKQLQISIQEVTDNQLQKLSSACPDEVIKFLLSVRSVSRQKQSDIIKANLFSSKEIIQEEIEESIDIYSQIVNMEGTIYQQCNSLKLYTMNGLVRKK